MCLLVAQTMASEFLLGGGGARWFQPSNFLLKETPFLFVSLHSATTIFVLKRGLLSVRFPSFPRCCRSSRVFLPVKRAPPKLRRLLSAAPSGRDSSVYVYFHGFDFGTSCGAHKQGTFSVCVDGINNISWSKRKVGPMLYVTELGTLESATAP